MISYKNQLKQECTKAWSHHPNLIPAVISTWKLVHWVFEDFRSLHNHGLWMDDPRGWSRSSEFKSWLCHFPAGFCQSLPSRACRHRWWVRRCCEAAAAFACVIHSSPPRMWLSRGYRSRTPLSQVGGGHLAQMRLIRPSQEFLSWTVQPNNLKQANHLAPSSQQGQPEFCWLSSQRGCGFALSGKLLHFFVVVFVSSPTYLLPTNSFLA